MPWKRLSAATVTWDELAHLNIIIDDRSNAVGLARPFPAMSGAEPWTASNIEASYLYGQRNFFMRLDVG